MNNRKLSSLKSLVSIVALSAALVPSVSSASVASEMDKVFQDVSTTTSAGVFDTQAGGAFVGGSFKYRTRSTTLQPAQINLPKMSGGCGGIDAWAGGFSWISGEQVTQFARGVIQAVPGLLFDLAISKLSEQLKVAKDKFENAAQLINSFQMDSCETAQLLVGDVGSSMGMKQKTVCELVGTNTGKWASRITGRSACATDTRKNDTIVDGKDDAKNGPLPAINENPTWESLKRISSLTNEDRYFLMSLAGSSYQILPRGSENSQYKRLPPTALAMDSLKAFMEGGTIRAYVCDDTDKCLNPNTNGTITIAPASAFRVRVEALINELYTAILARRAPSDAAKTFVEYSPYPIWRIVNVAATATGESGRGQVLTTAEPIAMRLLSDMLTRQMATAVTAAQSSQNITEEEITRYQALQGSAALLLQGEVTRSEVAFNAILQQNEAWSKAYSTMMSGAASRWGKAINYAESLR